MIVFVFVVYVWLNGFSSRASTILSFFNRIDLVESTFNVFVLLADWGNIQYPTPDRHLFFYFLRSFYRCLSIFLFFSLCFPHRQPLTSIIFIFFFHQPGKPSSTTDMGFLPHKKKTRLNENRQFSASNSLFGFVQSVSLMIIFIFVILQQFNGFCVLSFLQMFLFFGI